MENNFEGSMPPIHWQDIVKSYVDKAVLEERERCAEIAERFGDNGPTGEDEGHWTRGDEIAFQIRNSDAGI
jgi:hypothetical protein